MPRLRTRLSFPYVLVLAIGASVTACSTHDDASTTTTPAPAEDYSKLPETYANVKLNPLAHFATVAQADVAHVEEDSLSFPLSSASEFVGLQPGALLVGTRSNDPTSNNELGFMRKVVSVETNADRVVIHTEHATLEDVIEEGEFETTISLGDLEPYREGTPIVGEDELAAQVTVDEDIDATPIIVSDDEIAAIRTSYHVPAGSSMILPWGAQGTSIPLGDGNRFMPMPYTESFSGYEGDLPIGIYNMLYPQGWLSSAWNSVKSGAKAIANTAVKVVQATGTVFKGVVDGVQGNFDGQARKSIDFGFDYPQGAQLFNKKVSRVVKAKNGAAIEYGIQGTVNLGPSYFHLKPEVNMGAKFHHFQAQEYHAIVAGKLDAKISAEALIEMTVSGGVAGVKALGEKELLAIAAGEKQRKAQKGQAVDAITRTLVKPYKIGNFTIPIGPVPVPVTLRFGVDLKCQVDAQVQIRLQAGAETHAAVAFGVQWTRERGSDNLRAFDYRHDWWGPQLTVAGEAGITCALLPHLDALVADLAGPSLEAGPSAKLYASYESSCEGVSNAAPKGTATVGLDPGVRVGVGGKLAFLGKDIASFDVTLLDKQFTGLRKTWPNLTGIGYCGAAQPECGDGKRNGEEACEGTDIGAASCALVVGSGSRGQVLCNTSCELDVSRCSGPSQCGDGVRNATEACDGSDFGGKTCASVRGAGWTGPLACSPQCTVVNTGCVAPPRCGDGIKNASEQCDGSALGGTTCASLLGAGATGSVTCTNDCRYDAVLCKKADSCGDGKKNATEICDGTDLGGATCASVLGDATATGSLRCRANCGFDASSCTIPAVCGDAKRQAGEACDGTDFGGMTCGSLYGAGATGTLSCSSCTLDTSACSTLSRCGDGVRSGREACDGIDIGGATCTSLFGVGSTGTPSCSAGCSLDVSSCTDLVASQLYTRSSPAFVTGDLSWRAAALPGALADQISYRLVRATDPSAIDTPAKIASCAAGSGCTVVKDWTAGATSATVDEAAQVMAGGVYYFGIAAKDIVTSSMLAYPPTRVTTPGGAIRAGSDGRTWVAYRDPSLSKIAVYAAESNATLSLVGSPIGVDVVDDAMGLELADVGGVTNAFVALEAHYCTWVNEGQIHRFNGSNWAQLGANLKGTTVHCSGHSGTFLPSLYASPTDIFAVIQQSNGSWMTSLYKGTPGGSIASFATTSTPSVTSLASMAVVGSNLFTFADWAGQAGIFKQPVAGGSGTWLVNGSGFANASSAEPTGAPGVRMIAASNGQLWVAYRDESRSKRLVARAFDPATGTPSSAPVDLSAGEGFGASIVEVGGVGYAAYKDLASSGSVRLVRFDLSNSSVADLGLPLGNVEASAPALRYAAGALEVSAITSSQPTSASRARVTP